VSDLTKTARRVVGGLAVAGMAASLALTTAASSASAAAPSTAGTQSVTETTTAASGTLTLTLTYKDGAHGRIILESVSYSGDVKVTVRRPELFVSFSAGGPRVFVVGRHRRTVNIRVVGVGIKLNPADLSDFSGSFSAKAISNINSHGRLTFGENVMASVLSAPRPTKHSRRTFVHPVLNLGLILTP
jgi:hypothetical protein